MRNRRGFTLIEIMICIAILAIVLGAGAFTFNRSLAWFNREHDYQLALQLAQRATEQLRAARWSDLPPFVVPAARLSSWQPPAGLLPLQGSRTERRLASGDCLVSGSFEVPVRGGEAAHVPHSPPYRIHLQDEPVRQVLEVIRLDGPRPQVVQALKTTPEVEFDASMAGAAVRVEYVGRIRIVVSGQFLDANLRPTEGVGQAKMLHLEVRYGAEHAGALDLNVVRMP